MYTKIHLKFDLPNNGQFIQCVDEIVIMLICYEFQNLYVDLYVDVLHEVLYNLWQIASLDGFDKPSNYD